MTSLSSFVRIRRTPLRFVTRANIYATASKDACQRMILSVPACLALLRPVRSCPARSCLLISNSAKVKVFLALNLPSPTIQMLNLRHRSLFDFPKDALL